MKEIINKVVDRMIQIEDSDLIEECPISIININQWEWAQGVGIYGIYRYYESTGDQKYLNYLIDWFDARISEGLPEKNVNTCAPMLTLTFVYEITKNEKYLAIIKEWAEWVYTKMPKTTAGGLQHITTGVENKEQLWDDTLFMTVLFLAKAGVTINNNDYIEESKYQFLIHIKYLMDKKTGLWYHGWSFLRKDNYSEALWGRGNCWYTVGVVDYIDILNLNDGAFKKYLINTLNEQVDALVDMQDKNGMWHTLINEESSYCEASATAGFAYGIQKAVRKGYLDQKYLESALKAVKAIVERISDDGVLNDVSYGTGVGDNLEYYRTIELCPMTYGQALAILCLTENLNGGNTNAKS